MHYDVCQVEVRARYCQLNYIHVVSSMWDIV